MLPLIQNWISSGEPAWPSAMQPTPGHDLARGAEAALEAFMLDEGGLERMQLVALRQAFDRRDLGAVVHRGQRQAGDDPPAVEQDRARAAGALVAALLRAGEIERFAQHVEQRLPRIEFELPGLPIDGQPYARHRECLLLSARGGSRRAGRHRDETDGAAGELQYVAA